jgi:small conductance mechanosensitive channel
MPEERLMNVDSIVQTTIPMLTAVGLKILGALALWIVGRWLIGVAVGLVRRGLERQQFDSTLSRYLQTSLSVLLNIVLIVALLGFFGVETASFAALLAAGGVAIGVAWGGLLANFAAGAFLIFLRPFRVGDFVSAGGVTGTVEAIGLFGTTIHTPDNVLTIIGNNKIFSDTIQNFSATPYRRVDLTATINNDVDHHEAVRVLKARIAAIPNVLPVPAPDVEILQFTPAGPLLCVRPFCSNTHYWQVYFDTNRVIREAFGAAGFPAPVQRFVITSEDATARVAVSPQS